MNCFHINGTAIRQNCVQFNSAWLNSHARTNTLEMEMDEKINIKVRNFISFLSLCLCLFAMIIQRIQHCIREKIQISWSNFSFYTLE